VVVPDGGGGLDLTITEQFARSMTLDDALNPENLLCYEMNGVALPREHSFPVRLIAPGWYGVANVKWLTRIEVLDQQYRGNFMARDYVTIREGVRDGKTVWTFTNVRHDRLKSAPAKVTRRGDQYAIMGAAWGAPIADVEVQIDDGPWMAAKLERQRRRRRRSLPGRSGRCTGGSPPRASTRSGRGRSTSMATSSPRRTILTSPARSPSGRATGRSPVGC
jgi:DMSO/TMAO reductase YedYZ molybdopterin-dependent catalytic subunit